MKKIVAIAFFVILSFSSLPIIMKSDNMTAKAQDELSLAIINPGPDGYPARWNASTTVRYLGTSNFIFYSNETAVNSTFFVNVTIQNVELMKGWGIGLIYDATVLKYVYAWRPTDHVFKPVENLGWIIIAPPPVIDDVNETHKIVKWGCTYIMGDTPWAFNGTGTLCQIQFKIIKEVNITNPQATSYLTFDPEWTSVYYHPAGQEVPPFTPAYFEYSWPIPPTPLLKIEPPSYTAYTLNETFNINITINNLDAEWRLIAVQFALYYNTTIFEFVRWQNGTFLDSFVNDEESILYFCFSDFHGNDPGLPYCYNKIFVGAVILPGSDGVYHEPFPSGSGVIGTITLKVIAEPPVSTSLTLNETELYSGYFIEIPCNVEHAEFNFPFEDTTPPTIGTPTQSPPANNVLEGQPVTVSVNVTDTGSGVKNVTLYYTNNTVWYAIPMEFNAATGLWKATIPGHALGTQVKYKIEAYDNAGNHAVNDNAGAYYVYAVIPEFPSTVMIILLMGTTLITLIVSKKFKNRESEN